MKHYHNKEELSGDDVKFLIVKEGEHYRLDFRKVETRYDQIEIFQGVKFWLNRCKLIVDNSIVPTNQIIIWHSKESKKSRTAGAHFHIYSPYSLNFEITNTVDDDPNLGIFNVWTTDNKRCYEFTKNSAIYDKKEGDATSFTAKHGWTDTNKPTMEFEIIKL